MLTMETKLSRLEAIIPTLATREDLTRLAARIEALIPTLATREDLACLENRMTDSIGRVQVALHTEMNKQTWRIITLLATLLPALLAATVYVVKYL